MSHSQIKVDNCPSCTESYCVTICPALADYDLVEHKTFGRNRTKDERFGIYKKAVRAISLHPLLRERAYCGGTASALTYAALSAMVVDAAIICAWGDGEPWRPGPLIIHHPHEVSLGLGSKYFPSPNLRALRDLPDDTRVLFVGLPCHVLALRKMQQSEHREVRHLVSKVRIILGTFCGIPALLSAEGFASYLIHQGVPLENITRVSTEVVSLFEGLRSYRIHLGEKHLDYPIIRLLGEIKENRIHCDRNCFDYTSELADLSVGGTIPPELPEQYLSNALFIRTNEGAELVQKAEDMRILHTRPLGCFGQLGLTLFPPYQRKRARYLRYHNNKQIE
jgi:coenzyme F420-reducing hydrogenase beta subunit